MEFCETELVESLLLDGQSTEMFILPQENESNWNENEIDLKELLKKWELEVLLPKLKDRTLFVWTAANGIIGDTQNRKSLRVNVEYDHATKVCWSPDSRALIIHKSTANCIEVYKLDKKDGFLGNPVKGLTFSKPSNLNQENDVIGMGISCTGRFIMTCSNSTDIIIWTLKGNIIHIIDTCLMNNYSAKISSCGRFIGACGFSPDAKVWEVKFSNSGEYVKTVNAFNLTGHTSGIYDIAFDQDTSHMATVSKDGTWKLFNTKVEYEQGQLPRCLLTGKYTQSSVPSKIALSLNGEVIAIASGMHIEIFSGLTGNCDEMITKIYNGYINAIIFDPYGKYIVTSGDKCIHVFHNVTGYRVSTVIAKEKLKQNQTSATRERLTKLIEDNELFLKDF